MAARAPTEQPKPAPAAESLRALYTGPLADFEPPLVGTIASEFALPGNSLLEPKQLRILLHRFAGQYRGVDLRAIASQWSKWHFASVVVPFLAANLLLQRELPVGLAHIHVAEGDGAYAPQLQLPHSGRPIPTGCDAAVRFRILLEHHVIPLSGALTRVSGASPRVFTSNAGNIFEYVLRLLPQHPLGRPGVIRPGIALIRRRYLRNGRRNPFHRPVRYHANSSGPPARVRRLCCIRYLDPGLDYCSNCPLLKHLGEE